LTFPIHNFETIIQESHQLKPLFNSLPEPIFDIDDKIIKGMPLLRSDFPSKKSATSF
jgi:hypothetical protein